MRCGLKPCFGWLHNGLYYHRRTLCQPGFGYNLGPEGHGSTRKFVVLLSIVFTLLVLVRIFGNVYEWFSSRRLSDSDNQAGWIPDDQPQMHDEHIDNYGFHAQPVNSRAPIYDYQGYDGGVASNQMQPQSYDTYYKVYK
ncbi:hypothetical protein SCAR479_07098 [Seiridium cardinale]|uniref:Uncharacterized protein n=1 Tax=Seiridium cardinale TaxID=138064 RepID=A0ABR2XR27_9PEZI